jgi:hypothetical protein
VDSNLLPRSWAGCPPWLRDSHREGAAWRLYELDYARREAQAEADVAYSAWCALPNRDGYAVYRAAQDRADAAQDDLADWYAGLDAEPPRQAPPGQSVKTPSPER